MGITKRTWLSRMQMRESGADGTTAGGGSTTGQAGTGTQTTGQHSSQNGTGSAGTQPGGQASQSTGTQDALGEAGLKALHAERDARKDAERKLTELERKFNELNDKRPDSEKLQAQLAEITQRLENEKIERLRSQTALKHSISTDNLPLLTASTAEELDAQAARIAALQTAATAAAGTNGTTPAHQPNRGQGTSSSGEPPAKTLQDGASAYQKFKAAQTPQTTTK